MYFISLHLATCRRSLYIYIYIYIQKLISIYLSPFIGTTILYIYIYIYVCVCVCVCVFHQCTDYGKCEVCCDWCERMNEWEREHTWKEKMVLVIIKNNNIHTCHFYWKLEWPCLYWSRRHAQWLARCCP